MTSLHPTNPGNHRRTLRARHGFTLIEAALATIIIGTGVLAIVLAQQAFHKQNQWALRAATGMRLGGEIRELMMNLPRHDPVTGTETWGPEGNENGVLDFDDVDDFSIMKTIRAFQVVLQLYDFQWLIRTNLSTFWNLRNHELSAPSSEFETEETS